MMTVVGCLPSRANNIINNNIRFSYLLVDNMLVTSLITFIFFWKFVINILLFI
jgi:hypothetical protein